MTSTAPRPGGYSAARTLLFVVAAFIVGVMLTSVGAVLVRWVTDDSRFTITLADVVSDDDPRFANASMPNGDVCGGRFGCVEGIVGEGVSIYRYWSLDFARQAVIFNDTDVYRSDRLVIEFDDSLTADERYGLLQVIEGTWTGSND